MHQYRPPRMHSARLVAMAADLLHQLQQVSELHQKRSDPVARVERDRILLDAQRLAGDLDRGIMRKRVQYADPVKRPQVLARIQEYRAKHENAYTFSQAEEIARRRG